MDYMDVISQKVGLSIITNVGTSCSEMLWSLMLILNVRVLNIRSKNMYKAYCKIIGKLSFKCPLDLGYISVAIGARLARLV
jgi:hypothetical protein